MMLLKILCVVIMTLMLLTGCGRQKPESVAMTASVVQLEAAVPPENSGL